MKAPHPTTVLLVASLLVANPATALSIFVNEFHYDNSGSDEGEFIEIAGPAGADLSGWSLSLYNGNNNAVYETIALAGIIPEQSNGFGTLAFFQSGIQNGSPDGFALVDPTDVVQQFLSYEGILTATSGPAAGLSSTDIGVAESSSTLLGFSLQLVGSGSEARDFSWSSPSTASPGNINTDQSFAAVPDGGSSFTLCTLSLLSLPLVARCKRIVGG